MSDEHPTLNPPEQTFYSARSQEVKTSSGAVIGHMRQQWKDGQSTRVFISKGEIAFDSPHLRALADLVDQFELDPELDAAMENTKREVERVTKIIKARGEELPTIEEKK